MLDDMKIEEGLPEDRCVQWRYTCYYCYYRYIRVKYEDLVDNTMKTLETLYHHLGLGFSEKVKNIVYAHTHAENITGTNG